MHILYVGSSWAAQSFETTTGLDDPVKTNLAQELGLSGYTSLAGHSETSLDQIKKAQQFMQQNAELAPFGILFVTASSMGDGHKIAEISQVDFAKHFLTSDDPIGILKDLEQHVYQQLRELAVPVALIGASTDVICETHDNITVIHPSWQNFLANYCGLNSFYGWPANFGRAWVQGIIIPEYGPPEHFELGTDPSDAVSAETNKIKIIWRDMQKHKVFIGGHPTILGNQLFAQEIKQSVNNWIDKHQ